MSTTNRYGLFQSLEIIHQINILTRQNRNIDSTLTSIISYINQYNKKNKPISLSIDFNNKNYRSTVFNSLGNCQKNEFTVLTGKKLTLQICLDSFDKQRKDNSKDVKYLFDAVSNLIIKYLNSLERKKEKEDSEGIGMLDTGDVNESILSPAFLQKFLNKGTYSRDIYHDLALFKVKEILLISSLYDAYNIEREGRFTEHMLGQYSQLNLTSFPRITAAATISQAFSLLQEKHFDLIIYMVGVDKQTPIVVSEQIKNKYPYIPIFLLLNSNSDINYFTKKVNYFNFIDRIFTWNGDSNIFFSMIKLLEDSINVKNDTELARVRVILLVEDSPKYYSRYLSFLYKVVMDQTKSIIEDISTDELYKVLRMRVRPKILLASNFEEALEIIDTYKEYMLCLITDVKYKKNGITDKNAGIKLLKHIRSLLPNLPAIIQSSDEQYKEIAYKFHSSFIYKNSEKLYENLENFLTNFLGFGDFVFKNSKGEIIARARNMREFEKYLKIIPEDSLLFHASRDHFSMWLMARGEIRAASIINQKKVSDFKDLKELRSELLKMIKIHRDEKETGNIIPFQEGIEITEDNIYTLVEGSLGGKGRGLAFINALIHNYEFNKHVPDIILRLPKTFIVGTNEYENFIKRHNLNEFIYDEQDYNKIREIFIKKSLSEELRNKLKYLLSNIKKPLAVRSSSLYEDSLTQPFAGVFETYLLPNNHPNDEKRLKQVCDAVKLVFASVFSNTAKGYVKAVNFNIEDEKMAVIIQEVVGNKYENLYYPHISGVAQSYNFYPFAHMKPEEGFAVAALGLGKYVVDGNKSYRFSPKYPKLDINSTKDQYKNSQMKFYAIDLNKQEPDFLKGEMEDLAFADITVAEKHGTLKHLASVYNPDNNIIYPGLSKQGPRIINFANILKYNYIPLAKTLEVVLELGRESMGTDVEFEYAVDLTKDNEGRASFYILQIKPLINQTLECNIDLENIKQENIILLTKQGLGNGIYDNVSDIIYVDPEDFDKTETEEMAKEIEKINLRMIEKNINYVLIGPGRWGTRDKWIGIPVQWHQICNAKVIIETSLVNYQLDASSGSHFFYNVTSRNIGYFTVQPELGKGYINYDKLRSQKVIYKGKYFTHVRFPNPFNICMDGRKRTYVIYENSKEEENES